MLPVLPVVDFYLAGHAGVVHEWAPIELVASELHVRHQQRVLVVCTLQPQPNRQAVEMHLQLFLVGLLGEPHALEVFADIPSGRCSRARQPYLAGFEDELHCGNLNRMDGARVTRILQRALRPEEDAGLAGQPAQQLEQSAYSRARRAAGGVDEGQARRAAAPPLLLALFLRKWRDPIQPAHQQCLRLAQCDMDCVAIIPFGAVDGLASALRFLLLVCSGIDPVLEAIAPDGGRTRPPKAKAAS